MVKVCNKILHLQVDGRDITSSEVEIILGYIEDEIGDYGFFNENFDNHETLTLMSQVRKIIAQANGETLRIEPWGKDSLHTIDRKSVV